jgi:RNA polymerase-binding protein DksA
MKSAKQSTIKASLISKKQELEDRLERITSNVKRGYAADSEERAKEMEDSEVVDALGNEARDEIRKISAALERIDQGSFGDCLSCGSAIDEARLEAYPYAEDCIDCANEEERAATHR